MRGWVDLVGLVTYRGGIPTRRRSPIPVLVLSNFVHATNDATSMPNRRLHCVMHCRRWSLWAGFTLSPMSCHSYHRRTSRHMPRSCRTTRSGMERKPSLSRAGNFKHDIVQKSSPGGGTSWMSDNYSFGWVHHNVAPGAKSATYNCLVLKTFSWHRGWKLIGTFHHYLIVHFSGDNFAFCGKLQIEVYCKSGVSG